MSEADLHLKDLLAFYVDKCHKELLSISEDPVQVESMHAAIKRTREIILMMSCMIGAVTPGDIEAIRKISQIKLVAENEAAQMLRVGEDMALLRIWLKSAVDSQWNVGDAIRLFRTGRMTTSSSFPEMTGDLLRSAKKPFVVPSILPSNAESIRGILRTRVYTQFQKAKKEPPLVPDRITLAFNDEDDSVTISSQSEFLFKGIFDGRRWTIIEAQILDDVAGKPQCRRILQALSESSLAEMCSAVLRMATAQKLKLFQDEAVSLIPEKWSSIHSVTKSKAGIGNGFTVGIFRKLARDIKISFEMDFTNGDMKVDMCSGNNEIELDRPYPESFSGIIKRIEDLAKNIVFTDILANLQVSGTVGDVLFLPDAQVMLSLESSGSLRMTPSLSNDIDSVVFSDPTRIRGWYETFKFACKLKEWIKNKQNDGYVICASPQSGDVEISIAASGRWNEFVACIGSSLLEDIIFVCGLSRGEEGPVEFFSLSSQSTNW
jgi:hypothetical protein